MQDQVALTDQAPHLRADAERNRRRLLDAARTVFAEQGPDASIAEIRQLAGVGQGTVFRHFATKERLLATVVVEKLEDVAAVGRELLDAADPGAALREFMRASTMMHAKDRCLSEAMCVSARSNSNVRAAQDQIMGVVGELLRKAQDAGAVRDDVTPVDVFILKAAASRATVELREVAPDMWRRYLDLIFDGLRPEAAHPLSHEPPTPAQLEVLFPRSATSPSPGPGAGCE
jgi:AcrR family transcriptional regulator